MAFDINQFLQMYQQQQDKANAANEKRYQDILGTIGSGRKEEMGLLEGMGTASKNKAFLDTRENIGGDTQSLIDRGLFNTTVLDSMKRNRQTDLQNTYQSIDESTRSAKANAVRGYTEMLSGAQERRTDQGPNLGMLAQLLQGIGQGAGMQAGYGAGGGGGRSNSVIGGHPTGTPGGNNFFAGVGGGGSGGGGGTGVQTFTNPAYPRPGTPEFNRLGIAQMNMAGNYWANIDRQQGGQRGVNIYGPGMTQGQASNLFNNYIR